MVNFFIGVIAGATFGVITSQIIHPYEDTEYVDGWIRHCESYKRQIETLRNELAEKSEDVQSTIDDLTKLLDQEIWEL